jgi:hypothetical protein
VRRRQLVEIEDLAWCPDAIRDGGTDWLAFLANTTRVFVPRLTDRFPNHTAFADWSARSGGTVAGHPEPVDATDVPASLDGVRTLFNAFHHFPPPVARAILADAVRKRRSIVIVEGVDHRGKGLLGMPLQLPAVLLCTPWVRPFRWSRILLTYLVPLIPLLVLFDGTVSVLRYYLADELRELVAAVPEHETFDWDIGSTPIGQLPVGLTHLVGIPRASSREPMADS